MNEKVERGVTLPLLLYWSSSQATHSEKETYVNLKNQRRRQTAIILNRNAQNLPVPKKSGSELWITSTAV